MDEIEATRVEALGDIPHGFLGRRGGVSTGLHCGLNVGLGSDDTRASIEENRRRAAGAVLAGGELVTVHQVHSPGVVNVSAPFGPDERPHADAMVTDRSGLLLGILSADCVPVLFHDPAAGVVGAAHAGWKGALAGVTDSTVAAMEKLGASRRAIVAAVGPCIAQKSYEVDDGFRRHFAEADPENDRFFMAGREGHHQFDIEGYVAARLAAAGLTKIKCLGEDTYSQPERFFSYRRACHRDEAGYGRQISLIGLGGG